MTAQESHVPVVDLHGLTLGDRSGFVIPQGHADGGGLVAHHRLGDRTGAALAVLDVLGGFHIHYPHPDEHLP